MAEDGEKNSSKKSGLVYVAVLSIFFSITSMLGLGWVLDQWLETSPWLVVTGIILGSVVGFYEFIKIINRINN
jgi:F0F1-type ATP synthase assembly protein I